MEAGRQSGIMILFPYILYIIAIIAPLYIVESRLILINIRAYNS